MTHNTNSYFTPLKNDYSLTHHDTEMFSIDRGSSQKIDYKAKTFQLIKQVAGHELKDRKNQQTILALQRQLYNCKRDADKFFKQIDVNSFDQAKLLIKKSMQESTKCDSHIIGEMQIILSEYKKLLQSQQLKNNKLQNEIKRYQLKLSKVQTETSKETQLQNKYSNLQKQYNELFVQNTQLKLIKEEIQRKYLEEIQHFEFLQKHVEERIQEVQKEIKYYQDQRKDHLQTIKQLKTQLSKKQEEKCFSFGGVQSKSIQTDQYEQQIQQKSNNQQTFFSQQCFEASIKTLLQENARLKDALLLFYKSHKGEVPKEVELQLKILLSMQMTKKKQTEPNLINTIPQQPNENQSF